jgi:hypothetical protein
MTVFELIIAIPKERKKEETRKRNTLYDEMNTAWRGLKKKKKGRKKEWTNKRK